MPLRHTAVLGSLGQHRRQQPRPQRRPGLWLDGYRDAIRLEQLGIRGVPGRDVHAERGAVFELARDRLAADGDLDDLPAARPVEKVAVRDLL